jgi:hypothetical protein
MVAASISADFESKPFYSKNEPALNAKLEKALKLISSICKVTAMQYLKTNKLAPKKVEKDQVN